MVYTVWRWLSETPPADGEVFADVAETGACPDYPPDADYTGAVPEHLRTFIIFISDLQPTRIGFRGR